MWLFCVFVNGKRPWSTRLSLLSIFDLLQVFKSFCIASGVSFCVRDLHHTSTATDCGSLPRNNFKLFAPQTPSLSTAGWRDCNALRARACSSTHKGKWTSYHSGYKILHSPWFSFFYTMSHVVREIPPWFLRLIRQKRFLFSSWILLYLLFPGFAFATLYMRE